MPASLADRRLTGYKSRSHASLALVPYTFPWISLFLRAVELALLLMFVDHGKSNMMPVRGHFYVCKLESQVSQSWISAYS